MNEKNTPFDPATGPRWLANTNATISRRLGQVKRLALHARSSPRRSDGTAVKSSVSHRWRKLRTSWSFLATARGLKLILATRLRIMR